MKRLPYESAMQEIRRMPIPSLQSFLAELRRVDEDEASPIYYATQAEVEREICRRLQRHPAPEQEGVKP